jgi:hypothetical protein
MVGMRESKMRYRAVKLTVNGRAFVAILNDLLFFF